MSETMPVNEIPVTEDMQVVTDTSATEMEPPPKKTLPVECVKRLQKYDEALTSLEAALAPILAVGFDDHLKRTPLELLQVDVMTMFVLNSLGWCLAAQRGQDPKDSVLLADELRRTKQYVDRVKSIELRQSAPGLNKRVAKAFVRNALWEVPGKRAKLEDPAQEATGSGDERENSDNEETDDIDLAAPDIDEGPSYVVKNFKIEDDQETHQQPKIRTGKN